MEHIMDSQKDLSQAPETKKISDLFYINYIWFLATFTEIDRKRKRVKKSWFRILNALYLFTKRMKSQKNAAVFPSQFTLCKMANCGRSTLSEFINSPYFHQFCKVKRRPYKTNQYFLRPWVYKVFRFFYASGMMKGFREDEKKWFGTFEKRLNNWVIPSLEEGMTLKMLLSHRHKKCSRVMNKKPPDNQRVKKKPPSYEQKRSLKLDIANPLKLDTIKPYGEYKAYGNKTNIEIPSFVVGEMENLHRDLVTRFNIPEGDFRGFWLNYDGRILKKCARKMKGRMETGWKAYNPVRAFQALINEERLKRKKFTDGSRNTRF